MSLQATVSVPLTLIPNWGKHNDMSIVSDIEASVMTIRNTANRRSYNDLILRL